jgi:predicted GNAT superfamily acetyltransferase
VILLAVRAFYEDFYGSMGIGINVIIKKNRVMALEMVI